MLSSYMHRLRYIKKTEITFGLSACLFGFLIIYADYKFSNSRVKLS